ncbi:hypothetical protein BCR34DRAFT_170885 [Clohesyomyces aquaticus]|uniref:Uncharacterized protein n=1 Tax=Clohesyomyces aquaticus TaxID=1231657 RepID=A0A1Y1ZZ95_9PLEO|nr:hypothetical protein BCR34DRAFT_170885 [Clohesyomyces aquaticus]
MSSPLGNGGVDPFSGPSPPSTLRAKKSPHDELSNYGDDYSVFSLDTSDTRSLYSTAEGRRYRKPTEVSNLKVRRDVKIKSEIIPSPKDGKPIVRRTATTDSPASSSPKDLWKPAGTPPDVAARDPVLRRTSSNSFSSFMARRNSGARTPTASSSVGSLTPSSTPTRARSFYLPPKNDTTTKLARRRSTHYPSPLSASEGTIDPKKLGRLSAEMSGIRLEHPPDRKTPTATADDDSRAKTLRWRKGVGSYHGINSPPPELADDVNVTESSYGYKSPSREVAKGYFDTPHRQSSAPEMVRSRQWQPGGHLVSSTSSESGVSNKENEPDNLSRVSKSPIQSASPTLNLLEPHTNKSSDPSSDSSVEIPETIIPRPAFEHRRTLSLRDNTYVRTLEGQIQSLKLALAATKQALQDQEARHQEEVSSLSSKPSTPIRSPPARIASSTSSDEYDSQWQKMYEDKCHEFAKLHHDMENLRHELRENYAPDLKKQVKKLQQDLQDTRDIVHSFEHELQTSRFEAETLRQENQVLKERHDAEGVSIDKFQAEISSAAREYYSAVPHEQRDEVEYLQQKTTDLERQIKESQHEAVRLTTRRPPFSQFPDPYDHDQDDDPNYGIPYPTFGTLYHTHTPRQPNYTTASETVARHEILAQVSKTQKSTRQNEDALRQLVEKARKHVMGKHYPPNQPGYEGVRRLDEWERWHTDEWLSEEVAGEEDRSEAKRVGLLG